MTLADRIVVMREGRIAGRDPARDLQRAGEPVRGAAGRRLA